jgi:hypothetical protein
MHLNAFSRNVPYDVGLMKVVPENEIKSKKMYTWYSEEYYAPENFPERREALMMNEFCNFDVILTCVLDLGKFYCM